MPRPRRRLSIGGPVHVVNRGNERHQLFFKSSDYQSFVDLMAEGLNRFPVDVHAYCLMPNHFHLVVSQRELGAISEYLHRLQTLSATSIRESTASTGLGHVYQRRFWSAPINFDAHYLTVLRYVEANAVRALLVADAKDWRWGSLWERTTHERTILGKPLLALPPNWCELVNAPLMAEDYELIRTPRKRGQPRTKGPRNPRRGRMPKGAWPSIDVGRSRTTCPMIG